MTTPMIKMKAALLMVTHLLARYRNVDRRVSVLCADSRPLAPRSLTRAAPAARTQFAKWNVWCRRRAPIRGRSHPIRFANGTWLAAHSATWLARALLTVAHLLAWYRNVDRRVSVLCADSRPLAPHSLKRAGPGSLLTVAALFAFAIAGSAGAEVSELRITKQPSIIYLPLVVMEQNKLVEKQAQAAGLPELKVSWITFNSGGASTDALLSGSVDLVTSGVSNLLLLWERTKGQVNGVTSVGGLPMLLVTRDPAVKTLKDFTDKDKIAVPTIKVSSQAMVLKMAMEKMYGEAARDKLDSVTIQLGHPDAMIAVINGSSEVNSHFSAPPYQYSELKAPGVHLVLDSSDVFGGPASNAVVFGTRKFYDANPKTIAAFISALEEADRLIARDPAVAAKIYLDATKEKYSVDEIVSMIKAPNVVYSTTPNATMVFASFMFKTGLIKTKPASWKEFFFPAAHGFPGT
jgi:NitT/TauT family transport system substrate-binding protein